MACTYGIGHDELMFLFLCYAIIWAPACQKLLDLELFLVQIVNDVLAVYFLNMMCTF